MDILTYLLMVRYKANYYNQPQRIITLTIMKDSKSTSLLNEQCSFMVVDTLCAFYWLLSKQPTDCEIDWQSFDIAIFNEVVTNTYSYFLSGNDAGYLPDAVANKIGIYAIWISATYIGSSISITGVILAMMLIAIAALAIGTVASCHNLMNYPPPKEVGVS